MHNFSGSIRIKFATIDDFLSQDQRLCRVLGAGDIGAIILCKDRYKTCGWNTFLRGEVRLSVPCALW